MTNDFLYKIGVVHSPTCSFCGDKNEPLEHILISCNYAKEFWAEVIKWLGNLNIIISNLANREIILGKPKCDDELSENHVLLIVKQYLYSCRCNNTFPLFRVFINKLRNIHNLEREIAKSNNKFSDYTKKWNKFLEANT